MSARTIVATRTDLRHAIDQAHEGDTLILAGGSYGALSLGNNGSLVPRLTIRVADPSQPAVFTGLELNEVTGLSLDGLTFDYRAGPQNGATDHPFTLKGCTEIAIRNTIFLGNINPEEPSLSDSFGVGLWMQNCSAIRLRNNSISHFDRGVVGASLQNLVLYENNLHTIGAVGIDLVHIDTALIEGNYLHDFRQPYATIDPPDMIRLSANGLHSASRNIAMRHNWLDIGRGSATRAIMICAEPLPGKNATPPLVCSGLHLEGNMILNANSHGIVVDRATELSLQSNILLHAHPSKAAKDINDVPRIIVAPDATSVTIENNITGGVDVAVEQDEWILRHNSFLAYDDPASAAKCRDALVAAALFPDTGLSPYLARKTDLSVATTPPMSHNRYHSARPTALSTMFEQIERSSSDPAFKHDFHAVPCKSVGPSQTALKKASVRPRTGRPTPLIIIRQSHTTTTALDKVLVALSAAAFRIDITLKATESNCAGDALYLEKSFYFQVTPAGELQVKIFCANGQSIALASEGAHLCDMAEHRVSLQIDGGVCALWVDDYLFGKAPMPNQINISGEHDLICGNHGMKGFVRITPAPDAIPTPIEATHQPSALAEHIMLVADLDGGLGDRFESLQH